MALADRFPTGISFETTDLPIVEKTDFEPQGKSLVIKILEAVKKSAAYLLKPFIDIDTDVL